ncbi:MAG TPA: N-acetylglucosamine-6-phosphate deacetylase [Victivallales bacterium]|nr:N-acetylglucosamine-6-phosphate deacetylase [Victivallales bacterium]
MTTLIKNCRIISPDVDIVNGAVEIEDKIIKRVYKNQNDIINNNADHIIDAEGNIVFPGFVDIHTHGAMGADVTDGKVESIKTIAKTKLSEGVTTFCPTTLTLPYEKLKEAASSVAEYKKDTKYAKVAGMHLEGPFISESAVGAQNPSYIKKPDIKFVREMNDITKVAVVSFAIEVEGAIDFIKELKQLGIVSSCGHTSATYEDFKKAKAAGLNNITHFCNQVTKLHHREIGIVGAGLIDDNVKLEFICDKIHICPDMMNLTFKVRSPENMLLITDSMSASGLEDGDYDLGGLEVVVKDDAARLKSSGSLAGSTLKYYNSLKNTYEVTGLPLQELIKAAGYNQAKSLGIENIGKIEEGYCADIIVVNKDFKPYIAFVEGRETVL